MRGHRHEFQVFMLLTSLKKNKLKRSELISMHKHLTKANAILNQVEVEE